MKLNEALSLLELTESGRTYSNQEIKKAYRKLINAHHPDKTGKNDSETLLFSQLLNAAWATLSEHESVTFSPIESDTCFDLPAKLRAAIEAVCNLPGLTIEICGSWVWVTGETYQHKDELKEAGYKFSKKKKAWYFSGSPSQRRRWGNFSMDEIRDSHGSVHVPSAAKASYQQLPA